MKIKLYKVLLGVSVLAMAACSPAVGIMAADNGTQTETQETENIVVQLSRQKSKLFIMN